MADLSKVKVISICAKCSDMCSADLQDDKGNSIWGTPDSAYVPKFFPGEHWGDYVMLDIDLETGRIINWKKPSMQDLKDYVKKNSSENEDE